MIPKDDQRRQTVVLWPDNHLEIYASRHKAAAATGVSMDTVTKICNHKLRGDTVNGFRFKDHDEWQDKGF